MSLIVACITNQPIEYTAATPTSVDFAFSICLYMVDYLFPNAT
jgi:hypothetical protein